MCVCVHECVCVCHTDATFDGDVLITMTGAEGSTAELRLPADPNKAYNPGQVSSGDTHTQTHKHTNTITRLLVS